MTTASATKYCHRIYSADRCKRWSSCAAGIAALFAAVAAWAGPVAPELVVARASDQLVVPNPVGVAQVPSSASDIADMSIGFDQPPLDDHALSQYRGEGEHGVTPDTRTQHVAVILWDERGSGSQGGPVKSGSTGYGNNQATSVVTLRIN